LKSGNFYETRLGGCDTKSALITPKYYLVVETYPSGTLPFGKASPTRTAGTSLLFGVRVDPKGGIKPGFGIIKKPTSKPETEKHLAFWISVIT